MRVCGGVVRRVWVRWRWGTGGLCGAFMTYRAFQHWPLTQGGWFPSTVDPLEFADVVPIDDDYSIIQISGYNLDDTFPHTVWVAFDIERSEVTANMRQFLDDLSGRV